MNGFAYDRISTFPTLMALLLVTGCVTETRVVHSDRPGSVEGRVTLEGAVPGSWRIDEKAGDWPGTEPAPPPDWDGTPPGVIGVTPTGGVRGVAIWLEPAGRPTASEDSKPADSRAETLTFRLEGSCFWPVIAVLPAGGVARFENADARSHHVQFLSDGKPLDVFVGAGDAAEVRLGETGAYRLTCNDHAFMRADLIVAPERGSAVTDSRGRFLIDNVPSGHYLVRFGHHRLGEIDPPPVVIIGGGGRTFVDLRAKRDRWDY